MKLHLAYSTCPNDTFIFGPMALGLVDSLDFTFEHTLTDIKDLNALAQTGTPDIVKISYAAYPAVAQQYQLLEAGSALGRGCGPLLVTHKPYTLADLARLRIAIPGADTTAARLLRLFAPDAQHLTVVRFDEIMPAVASGQFDAGVIIHESRFTYPQFGLHLLQDLGAYWEATTGLPIPLGGIVAHRRLGPEVIQAFDHLLQRSVAYAFAHPEAVQPYIQQYAAEIAPEVQQAHIDLYVNQFSLALGPEGHQAIDALLRA